MNFEKTRPTQVSIGERRRPEPEGRPGYLRVDTVHQGDLNGVKGVYYINVIDEVRNGRWRGDGPDLRSVAHARAGRRAAAVSFSDPRVPFR
ncbi:MAG: hypothetical protein M3Z09_11215 [Acidobacteriota bacterium]|nr:hypothetical protein [Acidobacteriota bacterium]